MILYSLTIGKGLIAIFYSTLISFILAITVDMTYYELGALINYFWPPLVGIGTTIIFLVTCWISKNKKIRFIILILCCLYLIYIGIGLHFEKDYWPLVLL